MINKKYCNSSKNNCKKCGCEKKPKPGLIEKIKLALNSFLFKFFIK